MEELSTKSFRDKLFAKLPATITLLSGLIFVLLAIICIWGILKHPGAVKWFNETTYPFSLAILFFLVFCYTRGIVRTEMALLLAILAALISFILVRSNPLFPTDDPRANLLYYASAFALAASLARTIRYARTGKGARNKLRISGWGILHLGVTMIFIGVIVSSTLSIEIGNVLSEGSSMKVDGYKIVLKSLDMNVDPAGNVIELAEVEIYNPDGTLRGRGIARFIHDKQWGLVTRVFIDRGILNDIYVIFQGASRTAGPHGGKPTTLLRVRIEKLVSFIWIGTILMALGGSLILIPARRIEKPSEVRRILASIDEIVRARRSGLISEERYRELLEECRRKLLEAS